MIEAVAIKRGKGIDDLVSGYTAGNVEEDSKPEIVGNNPLSILLQKYQDYLNSDSGFVDITDELDPGTINTFLQTTVQYENHERYADRTGEFVSALIQNSYDAGYVFFQLNTTNLKPLNKLSASGTDDRPLFIRIHGTLGDNCFSGAHNINCIVRGAIGERFAMDAEDAYIEIKGKVASHCGASSRRSTFVIEGYVDVLCGESSRNCTFTVTGNVGGSYGKQAYGSSFSLEGDAGEACGSEAHQSEFYIAGDVKDVGNDAVKSIFIVQGRAGNSANNARDSSFTFFGDVGRYSGYKTTHCTFETYNPETIQKLVDNVWLGNKVIYIDEFGREQRIRLRKNATEKDYLDNIHITKKP